MTHVAIQRADSDGSVVEWGRHVTDDEYEIYVNPLVWGEGNAHVLGDRGTVQLKLEDVKRFDSGVVLLTYLPS